MQFSLAAVYTTNVVLLSMVVKYKLYMTMVTDFHSPDYFESQVICVIYFLNAHVYFLKALIVSVPPTSVLNQFNELLDTY